MSGLIQDLRYAIRMLAKAPEFTAVAVLTLALGIGATTAMFSIIDAVLFKPIPGRDPERLVVLQEVTPYGFSGLASIPNFTDWREQAGSFEGLGGLVIANVNLSGSFDAARIRGASITPNLFPLLGVSPQLGRAFVTSEGGAGDQRAVILSHGLWQRQFGGDLDVLGEEIELDYEKHTVVGVMPPDFVFPPGYPMDIWLPLDNAAQPTGEARGHRAIQVWARLREDVSKAQAQAEMDTIAERLEQAYPDANGGYGIAVTTHLEDMLRYGFGRSLVILIGFAGLVLLIACINVAHMLLARNQSRQREIALRAALGAGRWRLSKQLLVEGLCLASLAAALGILLAFWGVDLIVPAAPDWLELENARIDRDVLLFSLALSCFTVVLFAMGPSLILTRVNLNHTLKEGPRQGSAHPGSRRFRAALLVSEVGLSMVLLVWAGLLMRSFVEMQRADVGFDSRNLLTLQLILPEEGYPTDDSKRDFSRRVVAAVEALPGVVSVATADEVPLVHGNAYHFFVGEEPARSEMPMANYRAAGPDYFQKMGITMRRGRGFTDADVPGSRPVAVISEQTARRYFGDRDPIGEHITIAGPAGGSRVSAPTIAREIVGVARDTREFYFGLGSWPSVYVPYLQAPERHFALIVRTEPSPGTLALALREAVKAVDSRLPLHLLRTDGELLAYPLRPRRFVAGLMSAFSFIAVVLAAVGLYGVVAYSVAQRTAEMGLRMALGAQKRDVLRAVLWQAVKLAFVGIVAGLVCALALGRTMGASDFVALFGDLSPEPFTIALVTLVMLAVSVLASYIPARRATRVDPMTALRYE